MAQSYFTKVAYQTLQTSKSFAGIAHKGLSTKLMELLVPSAVPELEPVSKELLLELRKSVETLEKIDLLEAQNGIYPIAQLFEAPWINWIKQYPLLWLDLPLTWERRKKNLVHEIPKNIDKERYPDYYLQNFHHQTDGYLSDYSARLYDLQVEILFNGTADAMRRRILNPLKEGLVNFKDRKNSSIKVLDIGTGTGRTLKQIRRAFPNLELIGLDLSDSYLRQANKSLNYRSHSLTQLIRGNAEQLPFPRNSIQAITCVYLLHELPRKVRQDVIKECWRVLEPGGRLIIADSIQSGDNETFNIVLNNFDKVFHEPYYKDYIIDNISSKLDEVGFINTSNHSYFMTKIWIGEKQADGKTYQEKK